MSDNSTELTFICCPTCRSLVPAHSKTCRMCGGILEAVKEDDAAAAPPPRRSSRIRQRSMAGSAEDLTIAAKRIRDEMGEVNGGVREPEPAPIDAEEDPLSAYVKDVGLGAEPTSRSEDVSYDMLEDNNADLADEEADEELDQRDLMPEEDLEEEVEDIRKPDRVEPSYGREVRGEENNLAVNNRGFVAEETVDAYSSKIEKATHQEVPRREIRSGTRLCGWLSLVSNVKEKTIELREGKHFVSRQRVKENDIIIDDKSISTPHALMLVTDNGTLKIQDLMSDTGVFIRRQVDGDFEKIEEGATLSHGDLVRFGELVFSVCLIAHIGEV